ncbi:hypothetical protein SAMN05877809_102335 [Rhodobacter sp. JA431]|uniref:hypothetical protein n=1 Tax=Rhodobacter sp. JA431 TaxID=570013 RepID=UPI000BC3D7E6|nr:hypothetical protein [Rhodobacter sp. JA431]SOB98795.1 hypothetical protein SAMN05877809_102335 [Rhodobacter sp. JA431]
MTARTPFKLALKAQEAAKALSLTLPEFEGLVAAGSLPGPVFLAPGVPRWSCADLEAVLKGECVQGDNFEI